MTVESNLKSIPDDELLRRSSDLLRDSRRVEADLVAHIAEVDARRLYARETSPSMFAYCTEVLHLSEPEAALRIRLLRRATYKSKREVERLVAEMAPRPDVAATMRKLPVRQDRGLGANGAGAVGPSSGVLSGPTPAFLSPGGPAHPASVAGGQINPRTGDPTASGHC